MTSGEEREHADYQAKARQIREDFRSAVEDLNRRLSTLEGRIRAGATRAHESLGEGVESAQHGIRTHPLTAVAVAAGVGFLLGLLFYRRR